MRILKRKLLLAMPLLCFTAVYYIFFLFLERHEVAAAIQTTSFADSYIPFCEYFVIPYVLWFLFVPALCVYMLLKNEDAYKETAFLLGIGMSSFLIISFLFPTGLSIRPEIAGDNVFQRMVMLIYELDTPTNVFPSIHVYNTLACMHGVYRIRGKKNEKMLIYLIDVIGILIIVSTMLLKQHSLMDVVGAFLLFDIGLIAIEFEKKQQEGDFYEEEKRGIRKFKYFHFGRS